MSAGIVVVQQYQRLVVQKLGIYQGTQGPGLKLLIPILYHATKVDLRERVTRVPTQKYITADNVVVDMDFISRRRPCHCPHRSWQRCRSSVTSATRSNSRS